MNIIISYFILHDTRECTHNGMRMPHCCWWWWFAAGGSRHSTLKQMFWRHHFILFFSSIAYETPSVDSLRTQTHIRMRIRTGRIRLLSFICQTSIDSTNDKKYNCSWKRFHYFKNILDISTINNIQDVVNILINFQKITFFCEEVVS